jgi:putative transferase (TIGR04331 family)
MFLITTADQRFWNTDEPILFLGEWCKLFSQRAVWEKLSYEVLPYHWADRKKLYQDYLYLDKLYEQTLVQARDLLNEIHCVDHSLRYWRIVIGPWLYHFIQILYDRYSSIQTAIQSGKVANTFVGRWEIGNWVPKDFPSFQNWFISDDYNHYLYSQIIEFMGGIPFDIVEVKDEKGHKKNSGINYHFLPKAILKRLILFYEKLIPEHFNQIVLIASYLSTSDLIRFQLSMKQFPYLFPPEVTIPDVAYDQDIRGKLIFKLIDTEFEKLLSKMIKMQMPLIYIEGYTSMNEQSMEAYPKNPRVLFTANAYFSNEAFKFWAAHSIDSGAKLAGSQHGGNHGTVIWSANNNHEIKISDRYFTWGWESDIYKNVKPLVVAKLNKAKKIDHPIKDGRILLVLMTLPRYSYHMYSTPVAASGMLSYFNDQYRFVKSLSKENQKLVLVRLHRRKNQWSQRERWNSEFPEIECYKGSKNMLDQMKESRLLLCTYNSTTYLESFAANFPTVMFWNPDHWELSSSAQPYFDSLRRAGILHDTPESAAGLVNEISHDTLSWWSQPEIQKAKDEFCFRFARTSDNWLDEWKKELNDLRNFKEKQEC